MFYPGLISSPSYELAQRQFTKGYSGGMLSVNLKGGEKAALALVKAMDMIPFVPSLAEHLQQYLILLKLHIAFTARTNVRS